MKRALLLPMVFAMLLTSCQSGPAVEAETAALKAESISESAREEGGPAAEAGTAASKAESISETAREVSTAETRMMHDLLMYILQHEIIYADIQWALDAFDRFDAQKNWENLQLARSSLAIARLDISKHGWRDSEMMPEDQIELMSRGVDVSFLENAESMFEGEKTTLMNECLNLHYDIMEGVYLQDDWELCKRYVNLLKELIACDIQYLANTADWVLATLNEDEITARFNKVMDEHCPLTRAHQAEAPESPEAIEALTDSLVDHMEDLLLEESKIIGARSNRLNAMTEMIEQGDFVKIGKNMLEITDMPLSIPYPTWFNDEDIFYYWRENGEIAKTPIPGTSLERVPDGCKISMPDVTKEELLEYQNELEAAGLPCVGSSEDDGKLSIIYEYEDSKFAFIWEDGSVTILMRENPVNFVPIWYYPARRAMKR